MSQKPDEELLAWLADEGLILLTHDVQTLVNGAYACVKEGLSVLGVIEVLQDARIGAAVDELEVVLGADTPEDFANQVKYIPLH